MSRPRARLSSGHVRTIEEGDSPKLGVSDEAIDLGPSKGRLPVRVLQSVLRSLIFVTVVAAGLYLALAVTVVAVMGSGTDKAVVVRGAFPGGMATQGSFAYVSAQPYDRSFLGKATQAFVGVPGGSTVQTVALPGSTITTVDGQLMANQKPTGFYGVSKKPKLGHEYLVVCVSGTGCTPGAFVTVPDDRVIGQVRTFVGLTGFTAPHSYRK